MAPEKLGIDALTAEERQNLTILDNQPLIQEKLTRMRKKNTSNAVFRRLLREIGQLMAVSITNDWPMTTKTITTPMQEMEAPTIDGKRPALISILRAGNGLLDGVLDQIDFARVGYVGAYRDEKTLKPHQYYYKVPNNLDKRKVIAVDPMGATGNTSVAAVDLLKADGAIDITLVYLVAAPECIKRMHEAHPDVKIITCALDDKLSDEPGEIGYILPGLGDAGDRLYGTENVKQAA